MVPPACSILARAEAETDTPFTTSLRCSSPMPSSFTGWSGRRISPAPNSVSGVTSTPSLRIVRCRTFTTWAGCLNGLVKPRLGMRRISGIWPPSNPGRVWPPGRAAWPLPERTWRICSFPLLTGGRSLSRPDLRLRYFRVGGLRAMGRSLARLVVDRLYLDAALLGDAPRRSEVLQPVHRRAYHVVRVRRAQALGQDIAHAGALQHRPHRTAGDHAGTGVGRTW